MRRHRMEAFPHHSLTYNQLSDEGHLVGEYTQRDYLPTGRDRPYLRICAQEWPHDAPGRRPHLARRRRDRHVIRRAPRALRQRQLVSQQGSRYVPSASCQSAITHGQHLDRRTNRLMPGRSQGLYRESALVQEDVRRRHAPDWFHGWRRGVRSHAQLPPPALCPRAHAQAGGRP